MLDLFQAIPESDMDVLWANPEQGRPEHLILTHMLVPPVCIRPSVAMEGGGGTTEDDLTAMLNEILQINNAMRLALNSGSSLKNVMDSWDFLQVQVAAFMNGELPGLPITSRPKKPKRGMCQRLKGKQGRFRGNLLGASICFRFFFCRFLFLFLPPLIELRHARGVALGVCMCAHSVHGAVLIFLLFRQTCGLFGALCYLAGPEPAH